MPNISEIELAKKIKKDLDSSINIFFLLVLLIFPI
jgi:hypothetical protein